MKKNHRELVKCLGLISQLGITLVTPIFLCVLVGLWLDRRFSLHTTIVWLILGVLAGARSSYLMAKRAITPGEDELSEEEPRTDGGSAAPEKCPGEAGQGAAPEEHTGRRTALEPEDGAQGPDEGDENDD